MEPVEYGIIGGSGFYQMPGFEGGQQVALRTPFGEPSAPYVVGVLDGRRVAFLARHGEGHRLLPTEVNYRANLFGLKLLGARAVLSASAVGSLRAELAPGHALIPDQLVDRTRHRADTFFGEGIAAHVSLADPFCPALRARLLAACGQVGVKARDGGTYLCMEGPQFSTRAESELYRSWGMDVVGMTNLQEARLAREAELCYATLALVTDYDCWHDGHEDVSAHEIFRVLTHNAENAQAVLRAALAGPAPECPCQRALDHAVATPRRLWPEETRHRLRPLLARLEEGGQA